MIVGTRGPRNVCASRRFALCEISTHISEVRDEPFSLFPALNIEEPRRPFHAADGLRERRARKAFRPPLLHEMSGSASAWTLLIGGFEDEVKCCPVARLRLGPHSAAVTLNDSANGGQSDSGSGKFAFKVETLESAKKPVGIFHIESRTVIAHKVDGSIRLPLDADFNADMRLFSREFPGIAEKVFQHSSKQHRISIRHQIRSNDEGPLPF